jgi:phytoene synthase
VIHDTEGLYQKCGNFIKDQESVEVVAAISRLGCMSTIKVAQMSTIKVAQLIGSSQYEAVGDDALKDEDNAAWVLRLEPNVRQEWIERIGWIRLVDRLAEQELLQSQRPAFSQFYQSWQRLLTQGIVEPDCPYHDILSQIHDRWFTPSPDHRTIQAWERYLQAIATYHCPNLTVENLEQYEAMLAQLSGSLFQVLPFITPPYWQAIENFGIVDQFYNNLRDLQEDAAQGICYFPTDLLDQFGLSRVEILQMRCFDNPGYYQLMEFWLDEYLPRLRRQTYSLVLAQNLHPSWEILRDWSLHRYSRIERVFRDCNFNYALFPQVYWAEVKQDLNYQLQRVTAQQAAQAIAPTQALTVANSKLSQAHQVFRLANFLGLNPAAVRTTQTLLKALQALKPEALSAYVPA